MKRVHSQGGISQIVIVGGGTAGWLSACMIAASLDREGGSVPSVTLIESPDVPTLGVGEGTWPTLRRTLQQIGIAEADFLIACDASFKQGSRFDGWRTGARGDTYLHPFSLPPEGDPRDWAAAWGGGAYTDAMTPQAVICAADLAPRQRAMPDYAGALNYAYHLDAGRFAELLRDHAILNLGVRHLRAHVDGVRRAEDGDIAALVLRDGADVPGDLFIDCTGQAALLIGATLGVPLVDRGDVLFNDSALAVQVPVAPGSAIASQTNATAHASGWIWDIGLQSRRGVGCVYSSRHMDEGAAEQVLRGYLAQSGAGDAAALPIRKLSFRSGHRARFWERNCLAIGQSAGFLEPLEASAIVMIELALNQLIANFPADRAAMDRHARRFNDLFRYRWDRIVEFLKLHYVPSERTEAYWRDHRDAATIPERLSDLLALWRDQAPSGADLLMAEEVFPAASYQYVLYGMGYPRPEAGVMRRAAPERMLLQLAQVHERARTLAASLPTNRAYLDALRSSRLMQPGELMN